MKYILVLISNGLAEYLRDYLVAGYYVIKQPKYVCLTGNTNIQKNIETEIQSNSKLIMYALVKLGLPNFKVYSQK